MTLRDKINHRMDELENSLLAGHHLKSAEGVVAVLDLISSIAKFASILSDEERDFINAAKTAVSDKVEWK